MKKANMSLYDHLLTYAPATAKRKPYRSTQIIATVTPDMAKEEIIRMIESGMNIARFDAPNGKSDFKDIEETLKTLRSAVDDYNTKRAKTSGQQSIKINGDDEVCEKFSTIHVATALDLKGSYIETGTFTGSAPIDLVDDLLNPQYVNLTPDKAYATNINKDWIFIDYKDLMKLQVDQVIIINKSIKLKVEKIEDGSSSTPANAVVLAVHCLILQGGTLVPDVKMEVNIPGAKIGSMATREMAIPAIGFCNDNDMDFLIAPINNPEDFGMMRCTVRDQKKPLKVIAKVEGEEAVKRIDEIIDRADGVMVSRSRLGRNISPEQVVVYQKNIIAKCLKAGISSFVAGHVLGSIEHSKASGTRAEVADIVNSVLDGVDCILLDKEVSSSGCVEILQNSIMEAEDMINYRRWFWELLSQVSVPPTLNSKSDEECKIPSKSSTSTNVIAIAACTAAMVNGANAIVVLTESGKTVRMIAKYRPECPIVAVASSPAVARQCLMTRGVFSITAEEPKTDDYWKIVEEQIQAGISLAKGCCLIKKYPGVVIAVMGHKTGAGKADTIRIINVTKDKKNDKASTPPSEI